MSNGIPTDPVQALLAQTSLQRNLFTATSRYYGIDTETLTTADGTTIVYLKRRFLPSPDRFQLLQEHTVTQAERLDNIAAAKASGTLSQKITDQCRCSAMTPPSTGPAAPATIQTEPV